MHSAILMFVGNDRFPTEERGRIAAGYKKRSNGAGGRSQPGTSERRGAQRKPREVGAEPKPRQRHPRAYPRGRAFRVLRRSVDTAALTQMLHCVEIRQSADLASLATDRISAEKVGTPTDPWSHRLPARAAGGLLATDIN
jgi:hypothetical protein